MYYKLSHVCKNDVNASKKNRNQFVTSPKSNLYNYLIQRDKNQLNCYLKEIADLCGIRKQLTTHTARHTYATSVCLANGVSIENVAKMLGHSDTKMTRHYARVLDKSILRDMKKVGAKYKIS